MRGLSCALEWFVYTQQLTKLTSCLAAAYNRGLSPEPHTEVQTLHPPSS